MENVGVDLVSDIQREVKEVLDVLSVDLIDGGSGLEPLLTAFFALKRLRFHVSYFSDSSSVYSSHSGSLRERYALRELILTGVDT